MAPKRRSAAPAPPPPSHDVPAVVRVLDEVYAYMRSVGARVLAERDPDEPARPRDDVSAHIMRTATHFVDERYPEQRAAPARTPIGEDDGHPHPGGMSDAELRAPRT